MMNARRAFSAVAGAALGLAATTAAQTASWTLDTRTVLPPAGASDAVRQSIEGTPQPNVAASRQLVPPDAAAWKAIIQQRDAQRSDTTATIAEQLGVTIEAAQVEGVAVHRVTPKTVGPRHADHLFLYVHGGAYVFGGGEASVGEAAIIASRVGIPVLSVDYRMPPDHPFPAAVEDVVAVYRHLLAQRPARSIAIGGTSAGGGLSLAAVHRFLALGLDPPGAIYAGTPWADLTKTGDTLFTNEGLDRILVSYEGVLAAAASLYANGHDLKDPLISPVYGDFAGFAPTYLVTGTRDMFLSDVARTHRKLRVAGVDADLNVYEGLSHAGYLVVPDSPESRQVYAELDEFLLAHLD